MEVLVAMLVLTVGILAMAATTGYVFNQINDAGHRTERAFAVQEVVETLRALPYEGLDEAMGTWEVGAFVVEASVTDASTRLSRVRLVTTGPGYRPGAGRVVNLTDTTYVSISRGG